MPVDKNTTVSTIPTVSQAIPGASVASFLTISLPPDTTALLPVEQLNEVLKVPLDRITPVPHLPGWVLGVYNWRGEILWIIDLGLRVGLRAWHDQEMSPAVAPVAVLQAPDENQSRQVGLVVDRVEDIVALDLDQLQSPPNALVSEQLAPFLRGHWLDPSGQMLTLLDGLALLDRMPA